MEKTLDNVTHLVDNKERTYGVLIWQKESSEVLVKGVEITEQGSGLRLAYEEQRQVNNGFDEDRWFWTKQASRKNSRRNRRGN